MGFGNFLKDVATGAVNAASEKMDEIKELKNKYEDKSDEALFEILESSGGWSKNSKTEKMVAGSILKERGHGDRVSRYWSRAD